MSIYQSFIESLSNAAAATATATSIASYSNYAPENRSENKSALKFNCLQNENRRRVQHQQAIRNPHRNVLSPKLSSQANCENYELLECSNEQIHRPITPDFEMQHRDLIGCWLAHIRFEPELETMSCIEARTLTSDKNCASLMAIKCSYIFIQDIRIESRRIFSFIDKLINQYLPLESTSLHNINKFHSQISQLEEDLLVQIKIVNSRNNINPITTTVLVREPDPLTIVFTTPKKSQAVMTTLKPVEKLSEQIKTLCYNYLNQLEQYLNDTFVILDNGYLDCELRTLRGIYQNFLDVVIRAECLIIIEALQQNLQVTNNINTSHKIESAYYHLPLKWSLVALWKLTDDDPYVTSLLTEKWQSTQTTTKTPLINTLPKRVARKLDFDFVSPTLIVNQNENNNQGGNYTKESKFDDLVGVLVPIPKQVSPISLLVEIIVTQPNKHQRMDVINFFRFFEPQTRLIDLDDSWQSSRRLTKSSAIYTPNQFKAAALRILNHLCSSNDHALKTFLKLLSPENHDGHLQEENQIIKSVFDSYTAEASGRNIYQNETILKSIRGQGRQPGADDNQVDEPVVEEALSLFVQITNVFHQSGQHLNYLKLIGFPSIELLVKYLTNILTMSSSRKILLLSLSVLANMSFIIDEPMEFYGTNRIILKLVEFNASDIELRDQAVTLFANLAQSNPRGLIDAGGLGFILSCLRSCLVKMLNWRLDSSDIYERQEERRDLMYDEDYGDIEMISSLCNIENKPRTRRPIDLSRTIIDREECNCDRDLDSCKRNLTLADLEALERIRQKAAIAVARLSMNRDALEYCLENDVIKLLVELCKFNYKRNSSNKILISGVKALKRLAEIVDHQVFRYYNALDLIELDINRLLEIYGS